MSKADGSERRHGGESLTVLEARAGDKVLLKSGRFRGHRAVVAEVGSERVWLLLANGRRIGVRVESITNYSLAARKAWQVMPKRAGRPRSAVPKKRMASFRLDVDVLAMLDSARERGLIENRSATINAWLREQLTELLNREVGDHTLAEQAGLEDDKSTPALSLSATSSKEVAAHRTRPAHWAEATRQCRRSTASGASYATQE